MGFVSIAFFLMAVDFGLLLVNAAGVFPERVLCIGDTAGANCRADIGTRGAFGESGNLDTGTLARGAAGALLGAGIAILLRLSAELLLALSLMSAIFAVLPKGMSLLVSAVIPGTTPVESWLVTGLDVMFAGIYVAAVIQFLARQGGTGAEIS